MNVQAIFCYENTLYVLKQLSLSKGFASLALKASHSKPSWYENKLKIKTSTDTLKL